MPGCPAVMAAACSPLAMPWPAASTADDPHVAVVEERVEQAHGVRAAADGRHQRVRQAAFLVQQLRLGLDADHRLEVAHHGRVGMRAGDRADHVEGVVRVADPVAQRLVQRVLERARARAHRAHLGTQQAHAEHVGLLPLDVALAHVDDAFQAEARGHGGGGDAMLAGAGLGDDPLLAHPARQHHLAEHVVDLVRAGVVELVALEVDLGARRDASVSRSAK